MPLAFLTTHWPGSVEKPHSLIKNGTQLRTPGPKNILFVVRNNPGVLAASVKIRVVFAGYRYWLPNASEFEKADYQL
jgi:hypothetical protein